MARVVVVTGAGYGVGRAIAEAFGRRGDAIALLSRGRLEPPGFLLLNYGRATVVVTPLLHVVYGAIVGAAAAAAA